MREYDDDSNIQHYAPVLRRIIILVAVITAVPVMLWTITAFMHTYIAQPTIPAPRPLATATPSPAADTANPPAPSQPAPAAADATDDGRGDRIRDSAGNNAAPNVQVASTAAISPAPSAAPPSPAAVTAQAAPPPAPSVFPNPPFVTQPQPSPAASDAANDADTLPPPDPITGTVPLPRHRPSVLALADTDIPLPRARPSDAPEPASPTPDAPPSGYDPGIGH